MENLISLFVRSVSGLLRSGHMLRGGALIGDKNIEVFAEYIGDHQLGPWSIKSEGGLDEALEGLAHAVVLDFHRSKDSKFCTFEVADFKVFVNGLSEYQAYVRSGGLEQRGALDHLQRAFDLLQPLAKKNLSCGSVDSYLGSIYILRGKPDEAKTALQQAVARNPDDPFAKRVLARGEALANVKPTPAVRATPTDRAETLQALVEQPAFKLIHLQEAISEAGRGSPVKICVLSTGVSPSLAVLKNHISAGVSVVPGESGFDDKNGHGTSVSALIAAIAPTAQIVPIKVLDEHGRGSVDQILAGISYTLEQQARILLMPLSGIAPGRAYEAVLRRARDQGILLIASAGNEGNEQKEYPAALSSVLAVATINNQGTRADFSNYGPWVSLAAPGVDILTLDLTGGLRRMNGGSYSCAIVAGVAALVLSVQPNLSVAAVENILKKTAIDLTAQQPELKGQLGAGRVDALAAVLEAKSPQKTASQ